MINYELNRPDPDAMNQLLSENWDSASGVIVRLAWYLGLMRGEIRTLSWPQIDFDGAVVRLSGRAVPIPQDMLSYLKRLQSARTGAFGYIVVSDKGLPFTEQYISSLPGRRWTGWGRLRCA
jgi:integrase